MEAKVAMDIAQVDETTEFHLNGINNNVAGTRRTEVDLNEAPFKIKEEHLNRLRALSKTGMRILQLIFLSEILGRLIIITWKASHALEAIILITAMIFRIDYSWFFK